MCNDWSIYYWYLSLRLRYTYELSSPPVSHDFFQFWSPSSKRENLLDTRHDWRPVLFLFFGIGLLKCHWKDYKSYCFLSPDVIKVFDEAWGEMKGDCVNYFRWTDLMITEGSPDVRSGGENLVNEDPWRVYTSLCRQIGHGKLWKRLSIVTKNS